MAVGNEVAPDAAGFINVGVRPDGTFSGLPLDADGKLLVSGIASSGGSGSGGTVTVDFSATNALLGQIRTATQALLGADSPLPAAQLTALTSAISAAQTAIVAAQGGTTTATQSVLSALGPLQTAVVAVQAAVAAAGSGAHTDSTAEQVALAGLGSKLDVLTTTVAALQSTLSVTLKPQTIADLSSAIQSQLAPLFSSVVTAVQAGGADGTATVAALQAISAKLTSGTGAQALDLAPLVAALRADEAAAAAAAHTDAAAILSAALRTATRLEAGLSLTSPVTLDSATISALTGPLATLGTIATQTQGLATAAGQASALTALQAIQTATAGGATSAQQAAILTALGVSGDIVSTLKTLATSAGQASALAALQAIQASSAAGTTDLDAIKASVAQAATATGQASALAQLQAINTSSAAGATAAGQASALSQLQAIAASVAAGATASGQASALTQLQAIATSVAAGATAAGQASALTALQNLKTSTDAITTKLGTVLSVADSRMSFDASGRLTIAVGDVGLGATAANQTAQATKLDTLHTDLGSVLTALGASGVLAQGGGKTLADVVAAAGGGGGASAAQTTYSAGPIATGATASATITLTTPATVGVIRLTGGSSGGPLVQVSSDGTNFTAATLKQVGNNTSDSTLSSVNGTNGPGLFMVNLTGIKAVKFVATTSNSYNVSLVTTQVGSTDLVWAQIVGAGSLTGVPLYTAPGSGVTYNLGTGGAGTNTTPLHAAIYTNINRQQLTGAALAAGGTFTSTAQDTNVGNYFGGQARMRVNTDQSGTLTVYDGSGTIVANHLRASAPLSVASDVTAGPVRFTEFCDNRYWSVIFVNGGTAQTRMTITFTSFSR